MHWYASSPVPIANLLSFWSGSRHQDATRHRLHTIMPPQELRYPSPITWRYSSDNMKDTGRYADTVSLCFANRMGDELDAALLLLELKRVYF